MYFGKINKRQLDEIGTIKSPTKPLYLAKKNIDELSYSKKELEKLIPIKYGIKKEIEINKKELNQEEKMLKVLQEIDNVSYEERIEEEKIQIYEREVENLKNQKQTLEMSLNGIEYGEKKGSISSFVYIILGILFIVSGLCFSILNKPIIGILGFFVSSICFFTILLKNINVNREFKKHKEVIDKQKRNIENKIELVDSEIEAKCKRIKENKEALALSIKMKRENIRLKYPKVWNLDFLDKVNINEEQSYINDLRLKINKKELEVNEVESKIENLTNISEKLHISQEIYNELIDYNEVINIAKDTLEEAFLRMKQSITPKITENLSKLIEKITSGKYRKIKINNENEFMVETDNRRLYSCK